MKKNLKSEYKIYFSNLKSQISNQKGISMVELLITVGLFTIISTLSIMTLLNSKHGSNLNAAVNIMTADLKQQQIKAMVGDTEGSGTIDSYGIHFNSGSYALFKGTYSVSNTNNFNTTLPDTIQVGSTFTNGEIIFTKGTGEISGFNSTHNTITLSDSGSTQTKTMTFNRYGVITNVN